MSDKPSQASTKPITLPPLVDVSMGPPKDWKELTAMIVAIAEGVNTTNEKIGNNANTALDQHRTYNGNFLKQDRAIKRLFRNQKRITSHLGLHDDDDDKTDPGVTFDPGDISPVPHREHSMPEIPAHDVDLFKGNVIRVLAEMKKDIDEKLGAKGAIAVVGAKTNTALAKLKTSDRWAWITRLITITVGVILSYIQYTIMQFASQKGRLLP